MKKITAFAGALLVASGAFAWEKDNDPKFITPNAELRFDALPLSASLNEMDQPWASSFFPHVYGGIAFRWNNYYEGKPTFADMHMRVGEIDEKIKKAKQAIFGEGLTAYERHRLTKKIDILKQERMRIEKAKGSHYKRYFFDINRSIDKNRALSMTQDQLAKLSAAEKYDLYKGNYNLKLTKEVLNYTGPFKQYWEGICNGWSSAAIEFHEPKAKVVTNKDGLRIPFGSSDLKALLSYYHVSITRNWFAKKKGMSVARVGQRCKTTFSKESWFIQGGKEYYKTVVNGTVVVNPVPQNCIDTNPGAFHIVAANQLGLRNKGFVAEAVRDNEIWNQPVYKYDSKVLEDTRSVRFNATEGTVRQVRVKTDIHYANDGGRIFWGTDVAEDEFYAWFEATNGTDNYRSAHKTFEYYLDLNYRGEIIGGMWLSYDRPDFLWVKNSKGFIGSKRRYGIAGYLNDLQNLVRLRR